MARLVGGGRGRPGPLARPRRAPRRTEAELRRDPARLQAGLARLEQRCVVDGLVRRGELRDVFGYEIERDAFRDPGLEPATREAQVAFVTQLTACVVSTLLLRAIRGHGGSGRASGTESPIRPIRLRSRPGPTPPPSGAGVGSPGPRTPDALGRVAEALRAAPAEGLGALMRSSPDQAQRERALAS